MKGEEVDEHLVRHIGARHELADRVLFLQIGLQQAAEGFAAGDGQGFAAGRQPFYPRSSIARVVEFFPHAVGAHSFQQNVEPPVGQRHVFDEFAGTADRKDRWVARIDLPAVVARLSPVDPQQGHSDQWRVGLQRVPHHGAIARLEDVQGQLHPREQDDVGQRKDRNDVGKFGHRNLAAVPGEMVRRRRDRRYAMSRSFLS